MIDNVLLSQTHAHTYGVSNLPLVKTVKAVLTLRRSKSSSPGCLFSRKSLRFLKTLKKRGVEGVNSNLNLII